MNTGLNRLGLFWRTIRHLKPIQIFGRLWFKLYKPNINTLPLTISNTFRGLSVFPAQRNPSMPGSLEWLFLNERGTLSEIGWHDASRSKLWRYNQHYFDDLNAKCAVERKNHHKLLIKRWISGNPIGIGHGWEPYPTSLRIINWIKWSIATDALSTKAIESLSIQARWLSKRIEWHLLGNHLFVNAKALIFAGLFFEEEEANKWLKKGLQILTQQVPEQILTDGGHFELSTMYHALAIEDLLDLINVFEANYSQQAVDLMPQIHIWRSMVPKMLFWLNAMSHPDGFISFFNDAAFEIAPSNNQLFQYAARLGFDVIKPPNGITDLDQSGYVRLQSCSAVLIADIGRIGPDYLPSHAHADTLSFELSVKGQRIFVNSGTSVYGVSDDRLRQRGTLAHNTVSIAGEDSSEVWSGFRVGSRARIVDRSTGFRDGIMFASGAHDGYSRRNSGLIHRREFFLHDNMFRLKDSITYTKPAEARFYLHPGVFAKKTDHETGQISGKDGLILTWTFSGASYVKIIETNWHPEFGVSIPNQCIIASFESEKCDFILEWI